MTPDQVRPSRAAIAAATVTVVLWASAFVGIRAAAPYFSPGSLALGRLLAGSVVLLILLAISRQGLPPRPAWPGIITAGVIWFGLYMVALNWGEELVDAGTAAMLVNVGPAVMALLAGFPPRLLGGIAVSFAGTVVVGFSMSGGGRTSLLFTTWAYALARSTAGRMGATTYAVPAVVVVKSWLILDEVPGWLTLLGGALCPAGVAVSRSRPRVAAATDPAVSR